MMTRLETPIWGAARPRPLASRMMTVMRSASFWISGPKRPTGLATCCKIGWPSLTMASWRCHASRSIGGISSGRVEVLVGMMTVSLTSRTEQGQICVHYTPQSDGMQAKAGSQSEENAQSVRVWRRQEHNSARFVETDRVVVSSNRSRTYPCLDMDRHPQPCGSLSKGVRFRRGVNTRGREDLDVWQEALREGTHHACRRCRSYPHGARADYAPLCGFFPTRCACHTRHRLSAGRPAPPADPPGHRPAKGDGDHLPYPAPETRHPRSCLGGDHPRLRPFCCQRAPLPATSFRTSLPGPARRTLLAGPCHALHSQLKDRPW